MSKITVTELQGHTSGGDANKVKIATGHDLGVNTGSGSIDARLHVESHTTGHLAKFEGVANSHNHRVIIDASGTGSTTGLQMSNSNSNNAGSLYWSGANNTLNLQVGQTAGSEPTSGTSALVVDSSGRHMLPSGIVLGNGSVYSAANHLDDYEEGDWTPNIKVNTSVPTGINYSYREGRYRKIGSVCHVHWRMEIDTKGSTSSGPMTITDLPFSITQNYPIGVVGAQTMTAAFSNFPGTSASQGMWALGSNTTVYLRYNTTTGYGDWNWSAVPSAGINIWGSMTFNVT